MPSVTIDEDICIYVQRPFVTAFVRRLTPTAVTPNQITLLRALLGGAFFGLIAIIGGVGLYRLLNLARRCDDKAEKDAQI